MPATFNPARARGSTATPPAAPRPTTATSTGFRLMAMILPGRAVRGVVIRLDLDPHFLIVLRSSEARTWVANQIPTSEILVAPVVRIAEHSLHGEAPGAIEKRSRILKSRGRTALHRGQYGILLLARQIDKRPALGAVREAVRSSQPFHERGFFAGQIIAQRAIDVNGYVAFRRAGAQLR